MTKKILIPHIIIRPTDTTLVERLRRKHREYQERMGEYTHPELQLLQKPNTFLKDYILDTVLNEGQAELSPLVDKLLKDFPEAFETNKSHFLDAWAVVWDYCENAGKHTVNNKTGKSGLAE